MASDNNMKELSIDSTGKDILKNAYELGLTSFSNPKFYYTDDFYNFLESIANSIGLGRFNPQSDSDYKKLDEILKRRLLQEKEDKAAEDDKTDKPIASNGSPSNPDNSSNVSSSSKPTPWFARMNNNYLNYGEGSRKIDPNQHNRYKQNMKNPDGTTPDAGTQQSQDENTPKKPNNKPSDSSDDVKNDDVKKDDNNAKDNIEDKAKEAAKAQAAKKAAKGKAKEKAKKAGFKALLKNPWFIAIIVALVLVVSLVIVMIIFKEELAKKPFSFDLDSVPYVKMEFSEKVKVKINSTIHELTLDEATAAVTYREVTGMTSSYETLKAQAIAARSRILYEMSQSSYKSKGYIDSKSGVLGFAIASKNSKFMQAANDTHGIILVSGSTSNPSLYRVQWDALAVASKCGGKETSESFIVGQKNVEIPKSFLKKHFSFNDEWYQKQGKACHGDGMSQFGAYYLAVEKKYTAKEILEFFYDKLFLISLYPGDTETEITPTGECAVLNSSISSTPSSAKPSAHALGTVLKSHGSSISKFNKNLLTEVQKAGAGTRCAVVTAAVYTIRTLSSYGVRIPYQMPAYKPLTYGLRSSWGKYVHHASSYTYKDKKGKKHTKYYNNLGLDCGTFIQWSFYNGGVSMGSQFKHKGKTVSLTKGKPGDVLYHGKYKNGNTGHVMLIIKYSSKKQGYYVAEASGSKSGVKISFKKLSSLKGYKVKDLSKYYCSKSGCGKSGTKSNKQLKKAFS